MNTKSEDMRTKKENQEDNVEIARFPNILCENLAGLEKLQGLLVLRKFTLLFYSQATTSREFSIPIGYIVSVRAKKAFSVSSLEISWEQGVICQSVVFSQKSRLVKSEDLSNIPELLKKLRHREGLFRNPVKFTF